MRKTALNVGIFKGASFSGSKCDLVKAKSTKDKSQELYPSLVYLYENWQSVY